MKDDNFGINMKKWCRAHEAYIAGAEPSPELLRFHEQKIRWLQHERLVHLIVTVLTAIAELFAVDLVLLHPQLGWPAAAFMLGLAVLLIFYFAHYFFLENTVQRWYKIADQLREKIDIIR